MVGAILTQSASWANAEMAIRNLKTAGCLFPATLRQLPEAAIARLIFPAGYYNAKAKKLKALLAWLALTCGDNIDKLLGVNTVHLRSQLLGVYGIGPETADSIILYALNKPVFVIDAYTRRIITRLGLASPKDDYYSCQRLFTNNLETDVSLYSEYHALLVRLGKEVCRPHPLCQDCCLFDICLSNKAR
jgi:endonuclease-3 related protein